MTTQLQLINIIIIIIIIIKLVISKSLYYEARSEKHQIHGMFWSRKIVTMFFATRSWATGKPFHQHTHVLKNHYNNVHVCESANEHVRKNFSLGGLTLRLNT